MASENTDRYCICMSKGPQNVNDRGSLLNQARWEPNAVVRVKFVNGDDALKQRVREVAERWTAPGMADLTLNFIEEGNAEIRIDFAPGKGSWSYLGTVCRDIPADKPTMNYGWLTADSPDDELQRVVLHEFGHALGLIHEHQNPEGGIKWNEPAVIAQLSGPPNEWDEETIRRNVLDHYATDDVTSTPVDPDSIMMYPIPASWTLDGFSADLNGDLSEKDVELIREVYGGG
jgi:serralysin